MVMLPVTSSVVALPVVFALSALFTSNVISGCLAASSQSLPCMCSFIVGLGTCNEEVATTILPLTAAGFSGSKVTAPDTPLAVPLIDSSGASVLKMTVLTPFGSLKLKLIGAATSDPAAQPRMERKVIICLVSIRGK